MVVLFSFINDDYTYKWPKINSIQGGLQQHLVLKTQRRKNPAIQRYNRRIVYQGLNGFHGSIHL
ncbi:MAG: hypothetical protein LAT54_02235 [Cryomorphaceae bacterium]|nr:hypothetical protein [Cryomorphaceae bacterium]